MGSSVSQAAGAGEEYLVCPPQIHQPTPLPNGCEEGTLMIGTSSKKHDKYICAKCGFSIDQHDPNVRPISCPKCGCTEFFHHSRLETEVITK